MAECICWIAGGVGRRVSSPFPHSLKDGDVVSCCLDLSAPCISFRVNGLPVQGMLENFVAEGLLHPVVSFSAGVKWVDSLYLKSKHAPKIIHTRILMKHIFICHEFRMLPPVTLVLHSLSFFGHQNTFSLRWTAWRVSFLAPTRFHSVLWCSAPKSKTDSRSMSNTHFKSWRRTSWSFWPLDSFHSSGLHSCTSRHQQSKNYWYFHWNIKIVSNCTLI